MQEWLPHTLQHTHLLEVPLLHFESVAFDEREAFLGQSGRAHDSLGQRLRIIPHGPRRTVGSENVVEGGEGRYELDYLMLCHRLHEGACA